MTQPTASHQPIVLALTEEQSRQIERATGKFVTELQIEIVAAPEPPGAPLTHNHNHATEAGETQ